VYGSVEVFGPLNDLFGVRPLPSRPIVAVTAIIAAAAVGFRPAWGLLRHVVTIAHAGGHAGAAALTGRRLHGVRLHSDTSGLTCPGRPTVGELRCRLYRAVGVGLLAAACLGSGRVVPVLWVAVALLVVLLVLIRNLFGVLSVVVTGAALVGVAGWAPVDVQGPAAYLLAWFLLLAAPRPVMELQVTRRRGLAPASDADQLARLTGVPALLWVTFFLLITLAALVGGGWLLVRPT
jgi:hypothetical protein